MNEQEKNEFLKLLTDYGYKSGSCASDGIDDQEPATGDSVIEAETLCKEWVEAKKKEWQDEAKKEAEEDLRLLKKSDYFAINSMQDLGEWWYETAPEGYTPIDDQDSEVLTKVKIGDVRFKGFFDCKKVHLYALPVPRLPEILDSSKCPVNPEPDLNSPVATISSGN